MAFNILRIVCHLDLTLFRNARPRHPRKTVERSLKLNQFHNHSAVHPLKEELSPVPPTATQHTDQKNDLSSPQVWLSSWAGFLRRCQCVSHLLRSWETLYRVIMNRHGRNKQKPNSVKQVWAEERWKEKEKRVHMYRWKGYFPSFFFWQLFSVFLLLCLL